MMTKQEKDDTTKENLETFEDLIEAAGTTGWYNILIYVLSAWGAFVSPMHVLSYQFLGATSDYWCSVPELENANWTTQQIIDISVPKQALNSSPIESCKMYNFNYLELASMPFDSAMAIASDLSVNETFQTCSKRSFNESDPKTVSTMWDLVCDRRYIYASTQSGVAGGMLIGSLVMGSLADIFGRRTVYVWCVPTYLLIGVITAFAPNVFVYLSLKILIAAVAMSFYLCGMVLSLEICSTSQRALIGSLFGLPWAIGYMVLPGIAYLIRDFQPLQITATLTIVTLFPLFCVIPESPRWLIMKGRTHEAAEVIKKIASRNKRQLPSDDKLMILLNRLHVENSDTQESSFTLKKMVELWFVPSWTLKIAVIFFAWFCVSLVYYGVSLNPPDLSQDKYLYIFLGGVMEVPSYLLLYPITKYIGRKKGMVILFALCAVSIFGSHAITYTIGSKSTTGYGWNMFLFLIGKFSVTAVFQLIWTYTTEVFPTDYRSVIVGEASICARIGGICSPYIVDLLGVQVKWAPSAIFGGFSLLAAALILVLPETKGKDLSESAVTSINNPAIESTSM